ncbi:MAG: sugar phosphate isomerase/epimerase [Kiritimatiellae bacterium]|nr:sugar phosphate isomerase/epimerase [Kiritimatiellia bacterium]
MSAFKTGLVSITFRNLPPEELIELVSRAGQQGVEWGGDVHVPHGDLTRAEEVGRWTRESGLEVAAYGSYYRVGEVAYNPDFEAVLESAHALGAPTIRVWAGKKGSAEASDADRKRIEEDTRRICAMAADEGIRVAFEYHGNTLTDDTDSAKALLEALPLENLDTLWQPPNGQGLEQCLESLRAVLPRVSNVHVFHWGSGWGDRYALAEGAARWKRYLEMFEETETPRWALMEFVKNDDPEQYLVDAATLREWVDGFAADNDKG